MFVHQWRRGVIVLPSDLFDTVGSYNHLCRPDGSIYSESDEMSYKALVRKLICDWK